VSGQDDAKVLVVGGDPLGVSLAMDLTQQGVGVTLVETRAAGEPPNVRCNHVSARTMEIFGRLGLVSAVRMRACLPTIQTMSPVERRRLESKLEVGGLVAATARRGVSTAVLDVDADEAAVLFRGKCFSRVPICRWLGAVTSHLRTR
jgi:2-polyprenyl-6-methoxyphenol hydroxylase-like FAD-dependent oxidoreductase